MNEMTRRDFAGGASALVAALASSRAFAGADDSKDGLKVRFLGTGAADWYVPDPSTLKERRRFASILVEGGTLVDFTKFSKDMIPEGCRPEAIFYTHSHGDHYDVRAALDLGVKRVYCHESWVDDARREFAAVAKGRPMPTIRGMSFGEQVVENGVTFMSLPANHVARSKEHCSMYLLEKGATRLLYATDTGGIPGEAARLVGIDAHVQPGKPITALVMEATMGIGRPDDFRLFVHSSVETVHQAVRVLTTTGRYRPPEGQKVYLTHMARTLHGSHEEIAKTAPSPLVPAYDGLEVVFG